MINPLKGLALKLIDISEQYRDKLAGFIATQKQFKENLIPENSKQAALEREVRELQVKISEIMQNYQVKIENQQRTSSATEQALDELRQQHRTLTEQYSSTFEALQESKEALDSQSEIIDRQSSTIQALCYLATHPQKKNKLISIFTGDEKYLFTNTRGIIVHSEGAILNEEGYTSERLKEKSLETILNPIDSSIVINAIKQLNSETQLNGFEIGVGVYLHKQTPHRIKRQIHKLLSVRAARDIDGDTAGYVARFKSEKREYNSQPTAKVIDLAELISNAKVPDIVKRIEEIRKLAKTGQLYTIDLRYVKPTQIKKLSDLLPTITSLIANNPSVNAIGVYKIHPRAYTFMRDPSVQIDPRRLGLQPITYTRSVPNDRKQVVTN